MIRHWRPLLLCLRRIMDTYVAPLKGYCARYACERRTSAVTCLRYRFAQWHIPLRGAMIVPPSCVNEYSTATAFDPVTRLAINPVDSRLRRVLVSMRWEILPRKRRNCPCRYGFCFSENKIFGVHLPINRVGTISDPCTVLMMSCPCEKFPGERTLRIGSHAFLSRSASACLAAALRSCSAVPPCQSWRAERN